MPTSLVPRAIAAVLLLTTAASPAAGVATAAPNELTLRPPSPSHLRERRLVPLTSARDGAALGGLRLGMDERDVRERLGPPDRVDPSTLAARALRYDLPALLRLHVHVAHDARVRAIMLSARPYPRELPLQTWRGIRLGMPVARVVESYGPPGDGPLWYADAGVAFNLEGPADTVESIVVFPRGTPAP